MNTAAQPTRPLIAQPGQKPRKPVNLHKTDVAETFRKFRKLQALQARQQVAA